MEWARGRRTWVAAAVLSVAISPLRASAQPEPGPPSETVPEPWVAAYEWQQVEPSRFGEAIVGNVAASADGYGVAIGSDFSRRVHARSFFSRDGEVWKSKAMPGGYRTPNGDRHASPWKLVATPGELFTVGGFREPGKKPRTDHMLVWRSGSGRAWSEAASISNAIADDIAAGPDGLLIAGVDVTRRGKKVPTVWQSVDGSAWQARRLAKSGPRPRTVAIASDGVALVLGHDYRTGELDKRTWLWRSVDGGEWARVDLPGGIAEDLRMSVAGPIATPRGFLMATREEERIVDRLWQSTDGLEWREFPMPDGWIVERSWVLAQPWPWRSLVLPARALPGMTQQPSLLLTEDGGATWCIAESPDAPGGFAFDMATGPDGVIYMVGTDFRPRARVWVLRPVAPHGAADGAAAFPCQPATLAEISVRGGLVPR